MSASGHLASADDESALVEEFRQLIANSGATYATFSGMHTGSTNLLEGGTMSETPGEAPADDNVESQTEPTQATGDTPATPEESDASSESTSGDNAESSGTAES